MFQIRIDLTQSTPQVLTCWLSWINMRCRLAQSAIRWCNESASWLMFMDWCIDVLVYVLNRHVGWRLLMHWRVCWCVGLTRLLTFTNALTVLVAMLNRHVDDAYWCTDVLTGILDQHVTCNILLNAIVADQLLHLIIKRNKEKKNYMFITYSKLIENLHSVVAVRWNVKHNII